MFLIMLIGSSLTIFIIVNKNKVQKGCKVYKRS